MPFGILECDGEGFVPGTVFLGGTKLESSQTPTQLLKKGKGKYSQVILSPQPSDDPNDPLNWPQWQKESILLIVGMSAAVAGAFGPMLSPGFVQIAAELDVPVSMLAQATSWMILSIALSLFLLNPLAKIYGKRPIYVFAIIVLFISSIIGGAGSSYNDLLTSRILCGFGLAPYEILMQCTIGDLYFVHERATRIAFWNLCLLLGISAGSLIAGYIIDSAGWHWCFWICALLYGVLGALVILFVPETAYSRPETTNLQRQNSGSGYLKPKENLHEAGIEQIEYQDCEDNVARMPLGTTPSDNTPRRMPYLKSIRLYSGRYTNAPFLKVFIRPFILFCYPAVFAAFLIYGTMITWVVIFTVVNGVIFVAPPYNFTTSQTGLVSLSPLIMSLIGEIISGPLNDWVCLYLARKNNGIYEPEFRLAMMAIVAILGTVAFYGFGATIHYETHWSGPVITYGVTYMGLAFASTCLFGYVIDSHPTLNEEAFVAINARNILAFGVTYFVEGWLENSGALNVFIVLGSIFLGASALAIPLWIFGKRWRRWIWNNQRLQELMSD
ncbi:major facilitator superfamily domain-containing protein [Talaromyces proteolyticus]|uniref:Major facilitator superfamily domain-containing protein n=1 Tax=Talaromyces proteolyticus TaxID=1131652 RepID=A0AAD4KW13_9EURO|nr:major facilitator superfamily domain-containing protein [Talaromyces proteolyticus]KAH8697941.1 major facilitator superfamily domain-containing protein [Talaromyces proteolyticus]